MTGSSSRVRATVAFTRTQAQLEAARSVRAGYADLLARGRRQAREVIQSPAAGRYAHSRRVLREWFIEVYDHTTAIGFRPELGAAELEATARRVRASVRADLDPRASFQATAVIFREAQVRGNKAVAVLYEQLQERADRAAVAFMIWRDEGVRTHILRHWYRRCFIERVDQLMGLGHPMRAVTDAEAEQVTLCILDGRPRRLIDENGFPLMTAHGTKTTDVDRGLADGQIGLLAADPAALWRPTTVEPDDRPLRSRLAQAWTATSHSERRRWAERADVSAVDLTVPWSHLPGPVQDSWAATWLKAHAGQPVPFVPSLVLADSPAQAAAEMFNHAVELVKTEANSDSVLDVSFPPTSRATEISASAEALQLHQRLDPEDDRDR